MEIWTLLLRTVVIYFVVFLIMRLMGKREIGKMSVFDVVISFMIAEIAVLAIEDTKRPMIDGIFPMAVLMVIQVVIAFIGMKNRKLRELFDGKPSVIIAKGKLDQDAMRKQRYNLDDLLQQLRENQISRLADVEFAILETERQAVCHSQGDFAAGSSSSGSSSTSGQGGSSSSGSGSGKQAAKPKKPDIQIPSQFRFETLPIPLIMDGQVMDQNLEKLSKNRLWLKQRLRAQGVTEWTQVFFCSVDHKGELYVDVKKKHT